MGKGSGWEKGSWIIGEVKVGKGRRVKGVQKGEGQGWGKGEGLRVRGGVK